MLHTMTGQSRHDPERFVLPPISTLDEYIPNKNKKQNTSYNLLSPPNSFTPSTTSPSSFSSGHSPVMTQHPPSPPRIGFEKMDSPIYPVGANQETPISINNNNNNNNNSALHTISSDVDQVVQHAHSLCDNMIHYKPYLLSASSPTTSTTPQQHHHDELRPWMDDMIGKANQVLNSLLRLRKHQMASDTPSHTSPSARRSSEQHPSFTFTHPYQRSSSIPSSSSSNASSSSRITITKRDWPNTPTTQHHEHQHHYHHHNSSMGLPNTSIPSRQRKRGKRATFQGRCHSCNISETPEWRRGPDGARTLCNACGLHYAKLARKKVAAAAAAAADATGSSTSTSLDNHVPSM
ncbi:hypothetical protein BCR42DRAFT_403137 [Absidia repens]|uniref:GATA-type domain-containing protein n=1 Tax=Absidia repens TaxID=90262 RepID=A0A1X2IYX9_9FUNG|nr:hypothetical protein BCR42DRAFT_403137 [Absidia repens]